MRLGEITYPIYRVAIIALGAVFGLLLWLFYEKTRLGSIIRAGKENKEMVEALGINLRVIFTGVFGVGVALAAFAGVVAGPFVAISPGVEWDILVLALAVIIIGGLGSIKGAFIAALIVAFADMLCKVFVPQMAYISIFAPMALILVFKPSGLAGE